MSRIHLASLALAILLSSAAMGQQPPGTEETGELQLRAPDRVSVRPYEVNLRSTVELQGLVLLSQTVRFGERYDVTPLKDGTFELVRLVRVPVTVPHDDGGSMKVAFTLPLSRETRLIYDDRWRLIRVEGIGEGLTPRGTELPPGVREALRRVDEQLTPLVEDVLRSTIESIAWSGFDLAELMAAGPLQVGSRLERTTTFRGEKWSLRWEVLAVTPASSEAAGTVTLRATHRWAAGMLRVEGEATLGPDGFPLTATQQLTARGPGGFKWTLRVTAREVEGDPLLHQLYPDIDREIFGLERRPYDPDKPDPLLPGFENKDLPPLPDLPDRD